MIPLLFCCRFCNRITPPPKTLPDTSQVISFFPTRFHALDHTDFAEALEIALSTREKFRVGNLYLNKGSTGAMVGRQPFGGFNMSGVGSKTGGPDYLHQFMDPRCVTENTIRRGFTPIAEDDDWV